MTDLLIQFGVSNLCVSLVLAIAAWAIHRTGKRPLVAHLLCLLVLVKLVTPPLVTVPVVPVPGLAAESLVDHTLPAATGSLLAASDPDAVGSPALAGSGLTATSRAIEQGKTALAIIWLLGSAGVLAWSLLRIYRFNRLLKMASEVAPAELQRVASQIAQRLGLQRTPTICTTSANVSPMVWWIGRRARILIPAALPDEMDASQLRWILAHELAHVRRRDHLVRWVEWLACVCFWWNPVAWWARRTLRINEEICCDALVLSSLQPKPHTYANALMQVIEFLASPVIRPPAMASEMNSDGFLERRFRMIVSANPIPKTPRWLIAGILVAAIGLLPLGVAYGQDRDEKAQDRDASTQARPEKTGVSEEADDRGDGMNKRIAGALSEAGIQREIIRDVMGAMERISHEIKSEGEAFELDERISAYLVERGLTEEQIELVVALSRRLAAARGDSERNAAMWRRVAGALSEAGIEGETLRTVMGVMERIIHEIREEGDDFELNERVDAYLVELGLTEEHIELVVGLSQRPASRLDGERKREEGMWRRVAVALSEGGIPREQVRDVMDAMRRIIHEIKSEGEAFELDERLNAYLVELGLTEEQIQLVVALSQRLASRPDDDERKREEGMRRRVAAALTEAGIPREKVRQVMDAMGRIAHEIKTEGEAFELDERLKAYLVELGLTEEQIEFVVSLAQRRVSRGANDNDIDRPDGGDDRE